MLPFPAIIFDRGLTTVKSTVLRALPPTYPTALAAGTNPYFAPTLATGPSKGMAPATVAPSAPNLNFSFKSSAAFSLPCRSSVSLDSESPKASDAVMF